ncbi:MAG: hypothetical protein MR654_06170 [Corynebacterium glucuronolyticum]|nr:hypothetical protein [Corynebacterium glucuronolyticum]
MLTALVLCGGIYIYASVSQQNGDQTVITVYYVVKISWGKALSSTTRA